MSKTRLSKQEQRAFEICQTIKEAGEFTFTVEWRTTASGKTFDVHQVRRIERKGTSA